MTSKRNSKKSPMQDAGTAPVLYQKLGSSIYAITMVNNEPYYALVPEGAYHFEPEMGPSGATAAYLTPLDESKRVASPRSSTQTSKRPSKDLEVA